MKIIFMGTPDYAVPSLRKLATSKHEILAVVTQPDRQRNRGVMSFCPVKEVANLVAAKAAPAPKAPKAE